MIRSAVLIFLLCGTFAASAADWPFWRGPHRNGIAESGQDPPTEFGAKKNVLWSADVPGRGHGSPAVVGGRVFLAVADEGAQTQSLLCLDRASGERRWLTEIHRGAFPEANQKASHASSTPACDGERVFITFVNAGAAHVTALSVDGEQLWQKTITPYVIHQGYGSSPTLYQHLVIVSADNKSGGAIAAYDRVTGEEAWKVGRPKLPNYASPTVLAIGGRDQLVFQGCERVTSLDPLTGETHWEHEGATTECVGSLTTDGKHVFTSGGYPKNHIAALVADGSGTVTWENISRVYVPSMVVHDGYLFAVMDNGVASCWDTATGEQMWKERLGRTTSSSLVLVGDHFYSADEEGQFSVFAADPQHFEVIAQNQLGDETLSTPAICDSQIFARVVEKDANSRQEKLYCLARNPD
ncbi:PQQ-binding-like beta-propeller repeat protein [soil metagenome]